MRVLVVGAGAMGSTVGGFMAQAGHEVTLLDCEALMGPIREKGLQITGIWGEHHVQSLRVATEVSQLKPGDYDLILVSVKSYDTTDAIESIKHLVDENTLVCSYQNGLGNAEKIAEAIGWERTIGARVIFGVRIIEPGITEVTVIANPTAVGAYDPNTPVDRVREIAEAMDAAGVPTGYTDKIATLLWGKIAYNCALNPLSAILDVPYGVLAETEYTVDIIREVITELYAVAEPMQVALEPATPEAYLDLFYEKLLPPTAAHYASMREDFRLKRRTEIDALNGAICAYGRQYGVPCPTNTMITRLVHAREHAVGVVY